MVFQKLKDWCLKNVYSLLIILGAILGLICGFILKSIFTISPIVLTYIGLPGELIKRCFLMIIVPLIVTSIATSTSISGVKGVENKRLIVLTFVLIASLMTIVSIFGGLLVSFVNPGNRNGVNYTAFVRDDDDFDIKQSISSQDEAIYDIFMTLIPDNIIAATFMTQYTALVPNNPQNLTLGYKKVLDKSWKPNILGLCVFSLILGFTIKYLEEKTNTIRVLLEETNAIVMTLMMALKKVLPIGIFSWVCVESIKMKPIDKIVVNVPWSNLLFFAGTALLGYIIIWFVLYPGIFYLFLRKNIFKLYLNIFPALIVAFGSSSSAITLPDTMKCMEENYKLAEPVSQYVLPLGMNLNMPGTALYYPMVALFIAQMNNINVSYWMVLFLCIYFVVLSMALPAGPSGGSNIVYFITLCDLLEIKNPWHVLPYIMIMHRLWMRNKISTMTNITGDCIIAAILQKLCHFKKNTEESNNSAKSPSI